jgi:hypothetical protein
MGLPLGLDKCYYASNAKATLFSVGYLCSLDCSTTQDKHSFNIYDKNKKLLTKSPPLSNYLSPVDNKFLQFNFDKTYKVRPPKCLVLTDPAIPYTEVHLSPEVHSRLTEIENLHGALCHPGDTTLGAALDSGAVSTPSNCTSADVKLNRLTRLACPQCSQGKYKAPSYTSSTNQPTTVIDTLVIDITALPTPSHGGNTHYLTIIEETSGTYGIHGTITKKWEDVYDSLIRYIDTYYTAYGHTIRFISGDAEKVLCSKEFVAKLGKNHIYMC